MKKALLFLPLFLAACVSPGEVCTSYGFAPGTTEFAQCLQAEMQRRSAMGAASLQYFGTVNQQRAQPVYQAPPRPIIRPCRTIFHSDGSSSIVC